VTDDGDRRFVPAARGGGVKVRRYRGGYSIEVSVASSAHARARATAEFRLPEDVRALVAALSEMVVAAESARADAAAKREGAGSEP
jgi:hypothetical protein